METEKQREPQGQYDPYIFNCLKRPSSVKAGTESARSHRTPPEWVTLGLNGACDYKEWEKERLGINGTENSWLVPGTGRDSQKALCWKTANHRHRLSHRSSACWDILCMSHLPNSVIFFAFPTEPGASQYLVSLPSSQCCTK